MPQRAGAVPYVITMEGRALADGRPAFEAHKAAEAFKEAGFDDAKAVAVVATVGNAVGGNLATKTDIAELKADMLKVAVGIVVVNTAFTMAIVKLV